VGHGLRGSQLPMPPVRELRSASPERSVPAKSTTGPFLDAQGAGPKRSEPNSAARAIDQWHWALAGTVSWRRVHRGIAE
jgi:hypothetical protein